MLPSVPIFPVYNFFRQNIWHSIFDQFHFHHIFGDEMSIIRQDRQQAKALVVHFGDQLNVYLREELQIFEGTAGESTNIYFFKSKFHNEGGVCEKSYFEVFFRQWSHLPFPKISTFTDPPFTFFAYIPKIFDKYQMPIFFIEYLGSLRPVRTWLMYIWSKLSKN